MGGSDDDGEVSRGSPGRPSECAPNCIVAFSAHVHGPRALVRRNSPEDLETIGETEGAKKREDVHVFFGSIGMIPREDLAHTALTRRFAKKDAAW